MSTTTQTIAPPAPYLSQNGTSCQLILDGKHVLIFGGELHNSTFGSSKLESSLWSKLKASNVNAVPWAAPWEQIEPMEGLFDLKNLDECL